MSIINLNKKNISKTLFFIFLLISSVYTNYVKMSEEMERPLRKYVEVSRQGLLLPGRKLERSTNPKISIIIPMYNEEKNLLGIIRSIQNQSLQEIEIVCVNDNSNDKTLSMLKDFQTEDPRITIITNKKNRGVIYNRIYGALKSKGEYVTFVDADDSLANIHILEKAYNVATKEHGIKIGIVHYQTCGSEKNEKGEYGPFYLFYTFNPTNFNNVIYQPEIGDNYMQKKKHVTGSGLVFDKIYSKEVIKKVSEYIGPEVWNQNLVFVDDFLLAYATMKKTDSIVNIDEVGYYHLIDTASSVTSNVWKIEGNRLANPEKSNKKLGDYMIILEKMMDMTENEPQSLEFREYILFDIGKDEYMPTIARSIHYDKFLSLCERLYNWKYSNDESKEKMRKLIKNALSFKIDPEKKFEHVFQIYSDDD